MSKQTINGRAFEWAIGITIAKLSGLNIRQDSFANLAKASYENLNAQSQQSFMASAEAAVKHIFQKESIQSHQRGVIFFNPDKAGQAGDVRDVLVELDDGRKFGISAKNNHEALKHPRLSGKLNFIKKWGIHEDGCSQTYWDEIKPRFDQLRKIKLDSHGTAAWEALSTKADDYYWPILDSWEKEIQRIVNLGVDVEKRFAGRW